jgi:hypothetical protein
MSWLLCATLGLVCAATNSIDKIDCCDGNNQCYRHTVELTTTSNCKPKALKLIRDEIKTTCPSSGVSFSKFECGAVMKPSQVVTLCGWSGLEQGEIWSVATDGFGQECDA